MIIEKLKKEEFDKLSRFFDHKSAIEFLFSDLGNLALCEEGKFSHIRLSQLPYLSYEYLIAEDKTKSLKEIHKKRVGAGTCYALGGRLNGKSLCCEKLDVPFSMILYRGLWGAFSSYDAGHIRGVMENVGQILEEHPFFMLFKTEVTRPNGGYELKNKLGNKVNTVNENILGKKIGSSWFALHVHKIWYEEFSFSNDEASRKRLMSKSELGEPIFRVSGMCIFNKHSPAGRIFFDIKKRNWVMNHPAFINPMWSTQNDEEAIKEFGGNKNSLGYRTQINGEVVEDQDSAFDIELIRKNYNYKKQIKSFDITKKNFYRFKNDLIIERPSNVDKIELGMDVGEGSTPSEIVVFSKIGEKYHYLFNISLYQLTDEQEHEVLMFIYDLLKFETLGIDYTSGKGKSLCWRLDKTLPQGILVRVGFNETIRVKFDKDDKGQIKTDIKGNLQYIEEYVSVWSVQRLKHFWYNNLLEMPIDEKFDLEINNFVCFISGNRETYDSKINQDHLVAAFRSWAIGNWQNEFKMITGQNESKYFKGFVY